MNIAITGHASGLGKCFFDNLSKNHNVKGFDLENGYDITDNDRILQETLDCEVFINNAYSKVDPGQSELAEKWFELHKDKKHVIINIGSLTTRINHLSVVNIEPEGLDVYLGKKKKLEQVHYAINSQEADAKSVLFVLGILNTNMHIIFDQWTKHLYNEFKDTGRLIEPENVLKTLVYVLDNVRSGDFISSVEICNFR